MLARIETGQRQLVPAFQLAQVAHLPDKNICGLTAKPRLQYASDAEATILTSEEAPWATEGHSVALPGLGTMRFGLRAKSVEKVEEVKAGLISSRRIIFTPDTDLKEELQNTAVQITCYDRDGKEVKRVTSTSGEVEDPENDQPSNGGGNQNQNQGGNTSGGGNTGGGGGDDDDVTYD